MSTHHCPHDGCYHEGDASYECGECGWLCHACREDRSDARFDQLTEALALAGLLAGTSAEPRDIYPQNGVDTYRRELIGATRAVTTALRAERGAKPVPESARDLDAPSPYDPAGMADYLKRRR